MNVDPADPDREPQAPVPLDYRPAAEDRRIRPLVRLLLACFGTMIVTLALAGCAGVFFGGGGGALLVLAVMSALLAFLAVKLRLKPDTRPIAQGIWIGLGIALLIEGVCFALLMR